MTMSVPKAGGRKQHEERMRKCSYCRKGIARITDRVTGEGMHPVPGGVYMPCDADSPANTSEQQ